MNPVKGWVVVHPDKEAVMQTLSLTTRKLSVWAFLRIQDEKAYGMPEQGWKYWYSYGYRCIRVTLRGDCYDS